MTRSLFAKLSLALLGIIALLGGGFFAIERFGTRHYYEEITQRLNWSIATYITNEVQLIKDGVVNRKVLEALSQQAMIINPTLEIFLLDADGRILGHVLPPESVLTDRVDLEPVRALIQGEVEMPLRGVDPRNPERKKVFSAHPVMHDGKLEGYLYAVLGGQTYEQLANSIRGSYIQRLSFIALLAIVAAAFLVGVLVFNLLTRRLVRLSRDVSRFSEADFDSRMAAPLIHDGGDPNGDEISQLRAAFARMAKTIQRQFKGLKDTDRLRRELVSNVSHDLRTPLASMHGYVETLLLKNDTLSPEDRRQYLEIARKHTRRLGQLIGDLFELSKLDSACVRPQPERFSLAELLHDVVQDFELQAQQKQVDIRISARPEASDVYADIGLMQRVLENLIRNALKYTPKGGHIEISLDRRPDFVAVAVADTGCGIAEEDLEKVFHRFYRSEADADGTGSAGLGLAIVRRILDLHGRRITVSSVLNKGTRFEFALPVREAA